MRKKYFTYFICLALLTLLGLYLYFSNIKAHGHSSLNTQNVVEVSALSIQTKKLSLYENLPGRVVPHKVAEIRPQVDGIITQKLFKEGSIVEKGQQLYQINPTPYKLTYKVAKANLEKAKTNFKFLQKQASRYTKLVKNNFISQQEHENTTLALEQARAEIAVAEAAVNAARLDLDYTKVYAPISGYISQSFITEGALVTKNQENSLARITQLNPIYVDMTTNRKHLSEISKYLKQGKTLSVTIASEIYGIPYQNTGQLSFSGLTVDKSTGTILLRAIFPNTEQNLLPGTFVRARILFPKKNVLLVPQQAVIHGYNGMTQVWAISKDNKVQPKTIKIGKSIGNQWLVTSGLEDGEHIVLAGFQKIAPGMHVKPIYK